MYLTFALLSCDAARHPAPGDLELRPALPADADRLDLTALALEKGVAGFVRGDGPVVRIVAPLDPTLDDMTAALLLKNELEGQERPPAHTFARYVASLRKGVRPSDAIPLEDSPEGLFAALRKEVGDPLSDEARAAKLLAGWERFAAVLRPALARGADPHRETLFGDGSPFDEERQYLRRDRAVFERDRDAGQRWLLQLPGETAVVPALFLRRPKSSLFKFWARNDASAPGGAGFRLLAVWWGKEAPHEWVFSTDPLDRRRIDSLAAALQQAEVRRHPQHPPDDPWYDGARFAHTLVAPPRCGTRLSEAEVLAVVGRWGRQRRSRPWSHLLTAGLAAALVLSLTAGFVFWPRSSVPAPSLVAAGETIDPQLMKDCNSREVLPLRAVELPAGAETSGHVEFTLKNPGSMPQPIRFWISVPAFVQTLPFDKEIEITAPDGRKIASQIAPHTEGEPWQSEPRRFTLAPGDNQVVVSLRHPSKARLQAVWEPNSCGAIHLHVFTVGVSKYRNLSEKDQLTYPAADASALSDAFQRQLHVLFDEVHCFKPLLNEDATHDQIENQLEDFEKLVKADPAEVKLAVVVFAGHGAVEADDNFYFWPSDYAENLQATHLQVHNIEAPLLKMRCPVLLVLDTCHSGQAAQQLAARGPGGASADLEAMAKALARVKPGIMVLTATLPDQQAFEHPDWEHGALSLALLEVLTGRQLYPKPGKDLDLPGTDKILSLFDLENYATNRVSELVAQRKREQTILLKSSVPLNKKSIPIAVRPPRQP